MKPASDTHGSANKLTETSAAGGGKQKSILIEIRLSHKGHQILLKKYLRISKAFHVCRIRYGNRPVIKDDRQYTERL